VAEIEFDSLCAEREALRSYVLVHASSLEAFNEEGKPWFRRGEQSDEPARARRPVRHLTTTASCLQSLSDVPLYEIKDPPPPCPHNRDEIEAWRSKKTREFIHKLLAARRSVWKTEGEVLVYTLVRTLPVILHLGSEPTLRKFEGRLRELLEEVWESLDISDATAQGIGEEARDGGEGYPPNAFHTYWAIRLLHEWRAKKLSPLPLEITQKEAVARLWSRRTLATQTALISSGGHTVDAQQLAWALSADVLCRPEADDQPTTADHQHTELYEAALKAFFDEQKDGRWRLYEPLFHYKKAGNAYCYAYETLAELLRLALQRKQGRVLRNRLRPHGTNLVEAWHYARDTALELDGGRGWGWSSGHHPHRTTPEAWATASVFSYLQNLRCLLGVWAAEEGKRSLSVKPSDGGSRDAGLETLGVRGETWHRAGTQTVGRQLAMLFLHPLEATGSEEGGEAPIDPDEPLVEESRSAVLFGPPGGSKTSLVSGLANALGWDFAEVLASDFLSKGMNSVPELADEIFKKLMELDHCVILFDEIDELIRLRDDDGSDPFGRFLTTSMLPKLTKLWDQRRVLFFVATNDIAAADPAIKRSQRFDAAVFVPPPSFTKKKDRLETLLKGSVPELKEEDVEAALESAPGSEPALGVFAFLRWDQIDGLANRIETLKRNKNANPLRQALEEMGVAIERTDWKPSDEDDPRAKGKANPGDSGADDQDEFGAMFSRWREQDLDERRDYRDRAVLQLSPNLFQRRPKSWRPYGTREGYVVVTPEIEQALTLGADRGLELEGDGWRARDELGIFSFDEK
jgi:hypothetical protein